MEESVRIDYPVCPNPMFTALLPFPCTGDQPVRLSGFYRTVLVRHYVLLGSPLGPGAGHTTTQPAHTAGLGDAGDDIPDAVPASAQQALPVYTLSRGSGTELFE